MTRFALDSSAVLTWILQERRWHAIDALLATPNAEPVLLGPCLTEVVHLARRKGNVSSPEMLRDLLLAHGVELLPPEVDDLMLAAQLLELSDAHPGPAGPSNARTSTLSLADAMILAMATRRDLPVVTRDRHWSWLAEKGLISVKVLTF